MGRSRDHLSRLRTALMGTRHRRLVAVTIPIVAIMAIPTVSNAHAAPLWTLHGVVQAKSGTRVSNAVVGLSIMPSGVLAKPTPTEYIAKVATAPDGSFSIPAPSLSTAAINQAIHNDGWLNLQLDATPNLCVTLLGCGPGVNPYQMIADTNGYVAYLGQQAVSVLVTAGVATADPLGTVRGAPNDILLTVYDVQGQPVPPATPCVQVSCIGAPVPASQCNGAVINWQTIATENDWEPVGEIHTWDDMTASMKYGTTAATDLGVAFDYGNGNWTYGGSIHMGNSSSGSSGPLAVGPYTAQRMDGQFGWAKDQGSRPQCAGGTTEYRIRALSWTGGFQPGASVPGNDGPSKYNSVKPEYQADIYKGTPWDKVDGKSWKYTFEVSAFGVFTLSAESDYSSQVALHWNMGTLDEQHSLFAFGAPPAAQAAELIFASTEPMPPPTDISVYGPLRVF